MWLVRSHVVSIFRGSALRESEMSYHGGHSWKGSCSRARMNGEESRSRVAVYKHEATVPVFESLDPGVAGVLARGVRLLWL